MCEDTYIVVSPTMVDNTGMPEHHLDEATVTRRANPVVRRVVKLCTALDCALYSCGLILVLGIMCGGRNLEFLNNKTTTNRVTYKCFLCCGTSSAAECWYVLLV